MEENLALTDYITARFRLEILAENRALVIAEMLSDFLKRAPRLMAKFYRRASAIGLRVLLAVFDYQKIPTALLDYSRFKNELKGAPNREILKFLQNDAEKIHLPQNRFYSTHSCVLSFSRAVYRKGTPGCRARIY